MSNRSFRTAASVVSDTRFGSYESSFSIGSESLEIIDERAREAADVRKRKFLGDVIALPNLAQPQSTEMQRLSAKITWNAHRDLEKYILEWRSRRTGKRQPSSTRLRKILHSAKSYKKADAIAQIIAQWASYGSEDIKPDLGDVLCVMFSAFATFVNIYLEQHNTYAYRTGVQTRNTRRAANLSATVPRLLRTMCKTYPFPCGVKGKLRAKNALCLCHPNPEKEEKFEHAHAEIAAFAGIRYSFSELDKALDRILLYSRHLFTSRPNRRFAWGLAGCVTKMHACLMLHDAVLVSPAMDVATSTGRRELIKLLVNFALCDEVQLGFDPTIRVDPKLDAYIIDCFDDSKSWCAPPQQYRVTGILSQSLSVYGRHTRCYLAVPHNEVEDSDDDSPGSGSSRSSGSGNSSSDSDSSSSSDNDDSKSSCGSTVNNIGEVVIKDSWNVTRLPLLEDDRSEIRLMRTITEKLESESVNVDFLYPKMLVGGHVRVKINGIPRIDSTDLILKLLGIDHDDRNWRGDYMCSDFHYSYTSSNTTYDLRQLPLRAHRRMVLTPVAEHICTLKDEKEAVVVFADAMRCHSAIYKHCNIIHRYISMNNIMVVRDGSGGPPRGLLIDFDCGVESDAAVAEFEPEHIGTTPFMSINALSKKNASRTPLDDWESLLYLVCWIASSDYYFTEPSQGSENSSLRNSEGKVTKPIFLWNKGSTEDVAREKRWHMEYMESFTSNILCYFRKQNKNLYDLAVDLYKALFMHKDCCESFEYLDFESGASGKLRKSVTYPLENRAGHEKAIVEDLERVMATHREKIYNLYKSADIGPETVTKDNAELLE
ncbi:hypothetical protein H4R20_000458 [Coemansia guatemalensis]|uniref:Fungal-type protein kinase domain-containing protein n=1 Tax=Coemansia guatemalensis TaxID=2761395 RepID=A0A9W8LVT8_9FUNG|nr:hypothetical protein H4R20_000458 [Coemansia guatemalensis]